MDFESTVFGNAVHDYPPRLTRILRARQPGLVLESAA
jgi:hypothetical protein